MVRVLITGMGSTTAMSVLKGLRMQDEIPVEIVGLDSSSNSAGAYWAEHFEVSPRFDEPCYLEFMLDLCRRYDVKLLIPIVDPEFPTLARSRAQFESLGCKVAISDPEVISICLKKIETYNRLRQLGIPTPATILPLQGSLESWSHFPAIVKPNSGSGSRHTYRIDTKEQLLGTLPAVPDPVVQQFIEGDEYTVDILTDFDGKVILAVPRHRIETKAGICYKARSVCDQTLINSARELAEKVSLRGPACIQAIKGADGFKFIEINPRFAGSLVMTLGAGVNSPLLLLKAALGIENRMTLGEFKEVLMVRYWDEIYYSPTQLPSNGWELGWR
jgi:carbamoyl-phosphate synthase large subunit